MRHPHSRAERRHNRVTTMARRRQTLRLFYNHNDPFGVEDNLLWNQCSKHNLCCSCGMCRPPKTRTRRNLLKMAVDDNLRSWEGDLEGNCFARASALRRHQRLAL